MKFNQYTWNLYKQSSDGQKAIKEFEEANEKMTEYELFSKYNPNSAHFLSEDYFVETCDLFWACSFDSAEKPENHESAKRFYYTLTTKGIFDEEHVAVINEGEYQLMAMLPMILFTACSSDDDNLDDGTKYLSEIVIKEHEKKFGNISEYGELYEQYKYNQNGTIAEMTTNYYANAVNSRIDHTYRYIYDNQKRLIERNDYELTLFKKKYKYEYNSIDSVSRMIVYDNDGNLDEEWTYEYDSQRRLIKTVEKDVWLSNDFGYTSEYTYENNKVYVVKHRTKDGSLFGKYIYEYDSKDNLLQETYISGDTGKESIEQKYEYKYDSLGRIQRKSKKAYLFDDWTYYDYLYNDDSTINKISISYSYKDDESELRYNYVWK